MYRGDIQALLREKGKDVIHSHPGRGNMRGSTPLSAFRSQQDTAPYRSKLTTITACFYRIRDDERFPEPQSRLT